MALDDFIFFAEVIDSDNDSDSENEYNNDYESDDSDSSSDSYSTSSYRSYRPSRSSKPSVHNAPPKPAPKRAKRPSHHGCIWAILAFIIICLIGKACEEFTREEAEESEEYVEAESEYEDSVPLPETFDRFEGDW